MPRAFAGDLIPFYEALKLDHLRMIARQPLEPEFQFPEQDGQYATYAKYIKRLGAIAVANEKLYEIGPFSVAQKAEDEGFNPRILVEDWTRALKTVPSVLERLVQSLVRPASETATQEQV